MDEAAEATTGGAVGKFQFHFADAMAGTNRVDGHPDFHAVSVCKRQDVGKNLGAHRALTGDRCHRTEAAAPLDCPAGETESPAESTADLAFEHCHREVVFAVGHGVDQGTQLGGRAGQVAVADEDQGWHDVGIFREHRFGRSRHVAALAVRLAAANDTGAGRHRDIRSFVRGTVVGDPDVSAGKCLGEGTNGFTDAIGLVTGGDDDGQAVGGGRDSRCRAVGQTGFVGCLWVWTCACHSWPMSAAETSPGPDEEAGTPDYLRLAALDPVMAGIIERLGERSLEKHPWGSVRDDGFATLVETIVGQQVSAHVARVLFGRLSELTGGPPDANSILGLKVEDMRGAGLSARKTEYVTGLAALVASGELDLIAMRDMEDDEVERQLTAVRGIGPWSAQLYLMFHLRRPDIFPAADLGLQVAAHEAYDLAARPTAPELLTMSEIWRPYRTLASIYLWESRHD